MQVTLILEVLDDLRGINHPEHGPVWSIRDFINTLNEKLISDSYGRMTWKRLLSSEIGYIFNGLWHEVMIDGKKNYFYC